MKQWTVEKIIGIYHLSGVRETASGFRLNPDGTFQFFFTYGALDRYGSGDWHIEHDHVILQSRPWPGKDFSLQKESVLNDGLVTVKIIGNPQLVSHAFVSLKNGETGTWVKTNEAGEAGFQPRRVSTISVVFEFCPERFTHFRIEDAGNDYFELKFEPWLMEVFFDNFPLKIERYGLTGKHPLMRGEKYAYEKA